eukprot:GHVT01049551.1.p3 GENE.GHVT01049551.1~~GHVT01049551.1.p3  ORF type:complete len:100 (+),score=6.12 GHVT01049551.1:562-861(+)
MAVHQLKRGQEGRQDLVATCDHNWLTDASIATLLCCAKATLISGLTVAHLPSLSSHIGIVFKEHGREGGQFYCCCCFELYGDRHKHDWVSVDTASLLSP